MTDAEFENITMPALLEKYRHADEFELVNPYFDDALTDEQAQSSYGEIYDIMRRSCRMRYKDEIKKEGDGLPDFDTLYEEIERECIRYRQENAAKIKEHDGNAFFCDEFTRGKTKFTAPVQLWHIYHNVDFVQTCAFHNERLKERKPIHALGYEIENNPVLKDALIFIKITYSWHCTISGAPAKLFRFKLTDGAKAWLLTHKNDYDFKDEALEDLALYKKDKLLFSSCLHEHFHTDCEK